MSQPHIWTEADDAQLMELRADGWTHQSIAQMMGRTESSVQKRHSRLTGRCPNSYAAARLKDAVIDAQMRFANSRGINLTEAQEALMGGTLAERPIFHPAPHKTASAGRLRA